MKNTYKGDTPSKKMARLTVWCAVDDAMRPGTFSRGKFLFLAGPDCADASVAIGLGAEPKNLTAVDRNKRTAAEAKWRFPAIRVRHADVLEVVEEEKNYFDFIFLDFCAQMTDAMFDTTALSLLEGLTKHGLLACGFLAGREQDTDGGVRGRLSKVKEELSGRPIPDLGLGVDATKYLARMVLFQRELLSRTRRYGFVPVPLEGFFYRSRREGESHGMPMCIYLARVLPCSPAAGDVALSAALAEPLQVRFIAPTTKELGSRAVQLEGLGYDPTLLLNVSRSTLAAWKAHATRGTYK